MTRRHADGSLPAPGVYGLPEQRSHIRAAYERIGFRHEGRTEVVFLARVDDLARPAAPVTDLTTCRTVGINGTRIAAVLGATELGATEPGATELGYIEVDTNLDAGPRISGVGAWPVIAGTSRAARLPGR